MQLLEDKLCSGELHQGPGGVIKEDPGGFKKKSRARAPGLVSPSDTQRPLKAPFFLHLYSPNISW